MARLTGSDSRIQGSITHSESQYRKRLAEAETKMDDLLLLRVLTVGYSANWFSFDSRVASQLVQFRILRIVRGSALELG